MSALICSAGINWATPSLVDTISTLATPDRFRDDERQGRFRDRGQDGVTEVPGARRAQGDRPPHHQFP